MTRPPRRTLPGQHRAVPVVLLPLAAVLAASVGVVLAGPVADRPAAGQACPPALVGTGRFSDVPLDAPHELAVSCLADHGVVPTSAPRFEPLAPASADDATAAVGRVATLADVPAPPVEGRGGGVTRGGLADALAAVARSAEVLPEQPHADAFDDDEQHPHEDDLDALAAAGLVDVPPPHRAVAPDEALTRADLAGSLARLLDLLVTAGRVDSAYPADLAPARVRLDQDGRLVTPGEPLTGEVTGDRVADARIAAPCVATSDSRSSQDGIRLFAPTDRQAPIGRCPVSVTVAFDNGRTTTEPASVVLPGYTTLPEMVHVEPVRADDRSSEVRFVFDAPASLVGDAAGLFTLTTYDARTSHIATAVRQDGENTVVASFGTPQRPVGETELREVSYATAFAGALRDAQDRPSPTGTAHLNPRTDSSQAYAGPTWAADLLSTTRTGPAEVEFVFDRPLEASTAAELVYDVVLDDASGRRCAAPDPAPVRRVVVTCDGLDAGTVARGVVSAPGYGYDDPVAADLVTRGRTAAPDVVLVERGPDPRRLVLVFDEPVRSAAPGLVLVHGPHPPLRGAGARAAVDAADPRRVVVDLEGTGLAHASLLTVRAGAVTSQRTGRHNVVEQLAVAPLEPEVLAAGRTAMPDLAAVRTDDEGSHYDYDAPLAPTAVHDLRLYLPDGTPLHCRAVDARPDGPEGGTSLTCRDHAVGRRDGPAATTQQVRAAVYATASYGTPPAARVVEGAVR